MSSAASVEGRGSVGHPAAEVATGVVDGAVATGDGDGVSTGKGVGVASAVAVGMEVGVVSGADVADGLTDKEHATSSPVSERAINVPARLLARIGHLPGRLVGG